MTARVYVSSGAVLLTVACGVAPQPGLMPTAPGQTGSPAAPVAATAVRCGADQLAVLTQEVVGGQVSTVITCAERQEARVAIPASRDDVPDRFPRLATVASARSSSHGMDEEWVTAPEPRPSYPSRHTPRAIPVRSPSRDSYDDEEIVRVRARERSWQKRALVIGGATGVGAGVGALAGGKKGALIGAAIGAGGATLYEARK